MKRARAFTPFALSAALSCVLCSCPNSEMRTEATASASTRAAEMRATLQYELDGRSIPQPYVNARVGTHEARFLIDTGSNTNVIARWFADDAQIPLTRAPGLGSRDTPVMLIDHPLIDVDGLGAVDIDWAVVVDTSAIFEELGIAGTLSPQLLTNDDYAIVLDLQGDTLARVPRTDVLDMENYEGDFLARSPLGTCDEVQRGIVLRTLLVRGSVGGTEVQLALSSGALRTVVRTSGSEIPRGEGTVVSIGLVNRTVDVGAIEHDDATRCSWDGLIGRDFLSNCVLVFDLDRMAGRCLP